MAALFFAALPFDPGFDPGLLADPGFDPGLLADPGFDPGLLADADPGLLPADPGLLAADPGFADLDGLLNPAFFRMFISASSEPV